MAIEEIKKTRGLLLDYKIYIDALIWYREFGDTFGDKTYIDKFEEEHSKLIKERVKNNRR